MSAGRTRQTTRLWGVPGGWMTARSVPRAAAPGSRHRRIEVGRPPEPSRARAVPIRQGKTSFLVLPVLVILLVLLACGADRTSLTEGERETIRAEATRMLTDYQRDVREEGFLAELRYLDRSDQFFWVPPGFSGPISYDSVRTILIQNAPRYERIDNRWDTLLVVPVGKVNAAFAGRVTSTSTDTSGTVFSATLLESGLLVRREDGWKLLNGQTSILRN